jgi:thioredoxin 1
VTKPIHVTDIAFEDKVLKAELPVVVDFWAPWCGPCKMIAPVLEDMAAQFEGQVIVAKVNTDENPVWAIKYGVQGIPTFLFISNGEVVDRQVGVLPARALKVKVEGFIKSTTSVKA